MGTPGLTIVVDSQVVGVHPTVPFTRYAVLDPEGIGDGMVFTPREG